jgi:hypothetical protein
MNFDGKRLQFFAKETAGGRPIFGEGHPLGPILVTSQSAEFLEIGDRSFWIQKRTHDAL